MDSTVSAASVALFLLYGLGVFAGLGVAATVLVRRVRGSPSAELLPQRSLPAAGIIALLCLCFPVPFLAWISLWSMRVERGDGTSWSIPWKLVHSLSPVVPIWILAAVLSGLGTLSGGQTFLGLLVPVFVLAVALADAIFHRRPPHPGG